LIQGHRDYLQGPTIPDDAGSVDCTGALSFSKCNLTIGAKRPERKGKGHIIGNIGELPVSPAPLNHHISDILARRNGWIVMD
jgi:hypothetical protein